MMLKTEICTAQHRTLRWRHNDHDCVSNHQPHHCLLNCLFGRRSKKTWKLHVTGLCARNSPGTGEFPAQMVSNAENVSTWWRHHDILSTIPPPREWSMSCLLLSIWKKITVLTHLRPGQNGRHFAGDSFKYIFMNEKYFISMRISLKFVPEGLIDNRAAFVYVMAWHRTGWPSLPTHICGTKEGWVRMVLHSV